MTANAPENFGLPSCLLRLPPNLYIDECQRTLGSSEASAGKPAATRLGRQMQVSSDEVSLLQSQLQQNIDEIRHLQEVHQSKVEVMMERVLQSLSPATSHQRSVWAQRKGDQEIESIREELRSLKAFMEPQTPRMLHDSGLKEEAPSFQSFIQTELQLLKASIISEVQASKVECLANVESIGKILEDHGNNYKNKAPVDELENSSVSSSTINRFSQQSVNDDLPMQNLFSMPEPQLITARKQCASTRDSSTERAAEFIAGITNVIDGHGNSKQLGQLRMTISRISVHKKKTKDPHQRFLYRFALSKCFSSVCIGVVLLNGVWVGYECDHQSSIEHGWMKSVGLAFNIWFMVELAVKIAGLQEEFIFGPDWRWNFLDAFCVAISLPDFFALSVDVSVLRIIRLAKLSKTLRLVRVVKIFRSLKEILITVFYTLGALFWSFVAILLSAYVFAILLIQTLRLGGDVQSGSKTAENFSSLSRSILTLFTFITGGQDWFEFALEMRDSGSYLAECVLMLWIFFSLFGLVNVVVAVFCARAVEAQESQHELRLEKHTETREGKISDLIDIFQMIDTEDSGLIDWQQFHDFANDEEGRAICESHGLTLLALESLWDVMVGHRDKDALVDASNFVMGFMRLSNEHVNSDLLLLSHAVKALRHDLIEILRNRAH